MNKIAGICLSAFLVFALLAVPVLGARPSIELQVLGTYSTGVFDDGAAEIAAYDPSTFRVYVVNANNSGIDVLSIADPYTPILLFTIDVSPYGNNANSVAVRDGIVAAAVQADDKTDPGSVVFFDVDGNYVNDVEVGALPDMLIFTHNGSYVLVANEGEPNDAYTIDPEGSVSVIDIRKGVANAEVATAGFGAFENTLDRCPAPDDASTVIANPGTSRCVRIFGENDPTVAQDIEPEYIAIDNNSKKAYVTLQENNALAIIDIATATVETVKGLGFKNHNAAGNGLDPSDEDPDGNPMVNINPWPVWGMYMPDSIAQVKAKSKNFYITANEGDAREYIVEEDDDEIDVLVEEDRIKDLALDFSIFASGIDDDDMLGRLNVTTLLGRNSNDLYEQLFSFGARSISVWDEDGNLVWDSGDQIEQITAAAFPNNFNANNDENDPEGRSDNKGPEPEGVTVGKAYGRNYAFVGLERIGGIMVYDVTDPTSPEFVQYINNRDFSEDPEINDETNPAVGDLGPEGVLFISDEDSPTGKPLLVVANEISGTTTVYSVEKFFPIQPPFRTRNR